GFSEIIGTEGIHSIYESTATDNTNNTPEDDDLLEPVNWARVSATNKWAMLSDQLNDQTVGSGIEVVILPGVEIDNMDFFNVDAETIQIVVNDGTERYNETFTLEENFLLPGIRQDTLSVLDLPLGFPDAEITVTFENTSGDTKCGRMIMGNQKLIGTVEDGANLGIIDFSKKKQDTFGNLVIQELGFANRGDFTIFIETTDVGAVKQFLSILRSTPTAYIADINVSSAIFYGYYKDFNIRVGPNASTLT
ncbi:unnamed protein product, partial [marine sediment metagenome]